MWAAAENHGAAIKALVSHGADMNARSKELSFPEYRYETNGMAVFQLPKGGWTALMYAARQNAMESVSALADMKVDLNATTKQEGTTALQIAVINIHYDLANLLLERGADPNVVDSAGMTALYATVDMRAPANMLTRPEPHLRDKLDALGMVKSFLAHGANPNIQLKKPIIGRHQNLVGDGDADGRRHGPGAGLEDERHPGHARAARRRRGRDARARQPHDDGDDCRRRQRAGAESARSGDAARRTRRGRQRVQRERPDHPSQRRHSAGRTRSSSTSPAKAPSSIGATSRAAPRSTSRSAPAPAGGARDGPPPLRWSTRRRPRCSAN